jgi:ribosome maturation factor RimP
VIDDFDLKTVHSEVAPIIEAMGFSIVELTIGRSTHQINVAIVIYSPEGVGIDDCAVISKTIRPRLELLEGAENMRLEVSSPGLERVIKSRDEYALFKGRGVSILVESERQEGIIAGVTEDSLLLECRGETKAVKFEQIRKAKLDYKLEAGE